MAIFAFKRMREQNEAAQKAASVSTSKPKPKSKPQKVKVNGDNP
ncbi:hypothetical protein [uncultured Mediterranean phage uvMED]|jgi:hypothetical protein|nr:hypothetical protein [uncultured Mediterranean phage uvMED]